MDSADRDLVRFLTHLIASLQTVTETVGVVALELLHAPQTPPLEAVLTALLNDITATERTLVLVLDDYHVAATDAANQVLAFLVEQLSPPLHLVVISREDPALPLARLRARDQVSELRLPDLRFTATEAAAFLREVMGLELAADEVEQIATHTEGWATGLQLAALSLRDQSDPAALIRSFAGSHRFVLDYLVEEVLSHLPEQIQRFLLCTAFLDRLCGPLCDAVLGDPATPGQMTLEALERANLFLVPLDGERCWYRYHHLFAEALRQSMAQRLGARPNDGVSDLHSKASDWYEIQELLPEALHHAVAANDVGRITRLAERSWQGMDRSFQSAAWLALVRQLPDGVIQARPVLSVQYAWALMDNGDLEGSEGRLRYAECWLERTTGVGQEPSSGGMVVVDTELFQALPAMIAFARAYSAQASGDASAAARYAALALSHTPESHGLLRAQSAVLLALTTWAHGDLEAAYRAFATWVQQMHRVGNLAFALIGVFGLIEIRVAQGRLREAVAEYRRAQRLALGQGPVTAYLDISYALLQLEQGDRRAAAHTLQQSEQPGTQTTLADWQYRWLLARSRLAEVEGNWETVLDLLDEAKHRYVRTPVLDLRPIAAIEARVQLRRGQLEPARTWAREGGRRSTDELSYEREFEHLTLARVWIAEHRHTRDMRPLGTARALLGRLLAVAEVGARMGSVIEILILQSLAHAAGGDIPLALAVLGQALALAEPEGYVQIFVDEGPPLARLLAEALDRGVAPPYVRRLLAAVTEVQSAERRPEDKTGTVVRAALERPQALPEPLSEREREVLQLIAEGLSNQEVAGRLCLSLHTVKVHARNIYGKLGVSSRTQAVARGRALGLLWHSPLGR